MKRILVPILILSAVVGCSNPDDEVVTAPTQATVPFEGSVDKKLVGSWSNDDKSQNLDMKEDGTVHIHGFANTPKGKQEINDDMEWKADGEKLLFKAKTGVVQQYKMSMDKDGLELKTSKTTTKYKKNP
ncbi:MAG: hypothetical protein JST12_07365 [Armatimonadetes bacterium]|nr:hypothetical protein [Armatimonadota bacterium]MBS1701462.1 hypothetical protein [Armatimonadota bacterium]MBS1725486.1 hypothetical protein [Armatimonadota bacterium]